MINRLIFFVIGILGLFSLFNFSRAYYFNINLLFDGLFFCALALSNRVSVNKSRLSLVSFLTLYLAMFSFNSYADGIHAIDILIAVKPIVYLMLLFFFIPAGVRRSQLSLATKILLFLFLLKYSISIVFDLNPRPLVFRENNFELLFLSGFLFSELIIYRKLTLFKLIGFLGVVALSGSKSGLLLAFYLVVIYPVFVGLVNIKTFGILFFFALAPSLIYLLTILDFEGIDRFAMLVVFVNEVVDKGFLETFFGNASLTPLSAEACRSLYYYPGLFSSSGDGTCFGLILHLAHLRFIIDHGILAYAVLIILNFALLKNYRFKFWTMVALLFPVFINGLSVSAFYGPFYALYMITVISSAQGYYKCSIRS
jgi:hypothetical protein